ncbi:hypothetical protein DSL72_006534 [Monilinia vaccinii-corymbosi]|uniref:Major facilitator superfamily (MFS) profile domain-containing protein n=1 Tax=Monilinia vaccinii-corymbosi TaxID=61207 RepID=A0A8A3PNR4_9HELO|nr:hypothetical protein DSL72_006534 [Monilinia vaccinii-corymbosi]
MAQEDLPHSNASMSESMGKETGTVGADAAEHVEVIGTASKGPEHSHYHEKDGTQTYGGDEDHDHEPPVGIETYFIQAVSTENVPKYQYISSVGGIPPYIYGDLGGADRWTWFVLANLLALAAVCPFVGALSDLFGRRYIAIFGAGLIVVGMIICSTAQSMNIFIGKSRTVNSYKRAKLLQVAWLLLVRVLV